MKLHDHVNVKIDLSKVLDGVHNETDINQNTFSDTMISNILEDIKRELNIDPVYGGPKNTYTVSGEDVDWSAARIHSRGMVLVQKGWFLRLGTSSV